MKSLLRMVAAIAAVSAFCAYAQDDDLDFDVGGDEMEDQTIESVGETTDSSAESDDEASEESENAAAKPKKDKGPVRILKTLPFCYKLEGKGEVLRPGATEWTHVEEGKFYPLGSSFRTTDNTSVLQIQFGDGEDLSVEIKNAPSSFGTRFQPLGEKTRTISLLSGVLTVKLPRNLPDGIFSVTTPGFVVKNPKGMSRYAYTRTGDGEVAQIRCLTGSLSIEGRNFLFPEVKTACEVKIRTSQDQLFTGLYGNRGDSVVVLDQGEKRVKDFSTGDTTLEKNPLKWTLSPKTAVRIHRAVPSIGERMSVTVMTFDASGSLRNRCAFTEGCGEVNTGELGPVTLEAENAKKADASADVEVVDVEAEDEDLGDDSSSNSESSNEAPAEESQDAAGGEDDFEF